MRPGQSGPATGYSVLPPPIACMTVKVIRPYYGKLSSQMAGGSPP